MSIDCDTVPRGLPPTTKLFRADAYQRTCDAEILWTSGDLVALDRTLFYAESGGQEWDEGTISGHRVIDVQNKHGRRVDVSGGDTAIDIDTVVLHRLAAPSPFRVGQRVALEIDWARRYANMQNHSACHFMYAAIQALCGNGGPDTIPARGCHIHPLGSRMDFAVDLSSAEAAAAQEGANRLISRALPITVTPDPGMPDILHWRYGTLSIPCGGTHVATARELPPIILKRSKKGAGLTRISTSF